MAYKNSMPVISRIDQGVRDNDFIPINELKVFDNKLLEIVKMFESSRNVDSTEAASIAKRIKDIEYHLADALIYDEHGEIVGYNSTITEDGREVPVYGEDAIYNMLKTLEEYYGDFVKLMGSDPNIDNWKIDLDRYYNEEITLLKNKLVGIFSNTATAITLEAKNDKKTDYVLNDTVSLKKNQIMRLNPDLLSYIRNINILPSEQNTNFIAFEITELEKDSLALNLKVQSGFLYSDMNIILDRGKWFISREKIVGKELDNKFELNVFKYLKNGKTNYVFCFNTDYPEIDQNYGFEIEGLLVGGYNFNATGLSVDKHSSYYKYELVDTSVKPIYNETYYVKSVENYEKYEDGVSTVEERIVYIPTTKLLSFEENKEYYTRNVMFSFIKSFDILKGNNNGIINDEDKLVDLDNQLIIEDLSYSGEVRSLKVDYEVSEVFDDNDEADPNDYIHNRKKLVEDDSVRMYNNGLSFVSVGKSPKKIDNKISAAFGEEAFDVLDLKPCEIVNTNSHLSKDASSTVNRLIHGNISKSSGGSILESVISGEEIENERLVTFANGNSVYVQKTGDYLFFNKTTNAQIFNRDIGDEIREANVEFTNQYGDVTIEHIGDNYVLVSSTQLEDNLTTASGFYKSNPSHISNISWSGQTYKCNHGKSKKLYIIYDNSTFTHITTEASGISGQHDLNNPIFTISDGKLFILGLQPYQKSDSKGSISKSDTAGLGTSGGNRSYTTSEPVNWAKSDSQGASAIYLVIHDINNKTYLKKGRIINHNNTGAPLIYIGYSEQKTWSDSYIGISYTDYLNLYVRKRPLEISNLVVNSLDTSGNKFIRFFVKSDTNGTAASAWNRSYFFTINYTNIDSLVFTREDSAVTSGAYIGTNIDKDNYDYAHDFIQQEELILSNKTVKSGSSYIPTTNVFVQGFQNGSLIDTATTGKYVNLATGIRDYKENIHILKDTSAYYVWQKYSKKLFCVKTDQSVPNVVLTECDTLMATTEIESITDFKKINNKFYLIGNDISGNARVYEFTDIDASATEILTPLNEHVSDVLSIKTHTLSSNHTYLETSTDKLVFISGDKPYIYGDYYRRVVTSQSNTEYSYSQVDDLSQPPSENVDYFTMDDTSGEEVYTQVENLTEWVPDVTYYTRTENTVTEELTPDGSTTYYSKNLDSSYTEHLPGSLVSFDQSTEYYTKEPNSLVEMIPDATSDFSSITELTSLNESDQITNHRAYISFDSELYVLVTSIDSGSMVTELNLISDVDSSTNLFLNNYNDDYDFVYYVKDSTNTTKLIKLEDFTTEDIELLTSSDATPIFTKSHFFMKDDESLYQLQRRSNTFEEIITENEVFSVLEVTSDNLFFAIENSLVELFKHVDGAKMYNITSNANPNVYTGGKIYLTENEFYKNDIIENPEILDNLIRSNDTILSKRMSIINNYIKNNLVFINSFEIGILKRNANTVDIIIIPDNAEVANGDFYMLFTLNISSDIFNKTAIEKVLVYHGLTKLEEEFVNKKTLYQETWTSIASNQHITVAIGNSGIFYSYSCDTFHRLIDPITTNTREEIVIDDSFEITYDNYKYFFITKKDKTSTDHTVYISEDGIRWAKSNFDLIINNLKGQAYYPKIYTAGLNKTWFIGRDIGKTLMLDGVGISRFISKYTEYYIYGEADLYTDSLHMFVLEFNCADLIFTDEFYYALDITNERFIYARPNETTNILEYILTAAWTPITITDQTFTSPRIFDFKIYGHDLRGAILYGSGRNDPTAIGLWYSTYSAPGTFTKSTITDTEIGVKEFYPCVAIYKNTNGSETPKDIIYIKGTNDKFYVTEDFATSWVEETGLRNIMYAGSHNNWFIIKNTNSGIVSGRTIDGLPNIQSDFSSPLGNPSACISRNLVKSIGYNVFHVTDNTTGKILFSTDLEHWYATSVVSYNPITELNDSGDRIVGSTSLYPISINKNFDESYCPSGKNPIHNVKTLNNHSVYISLNESGKIVMHIDDREQLIPNSEGIDPSNFLIITLSDSKVRYCMCSETNRGLWITDATSIGEFPIALTSTQLDIYVENGFQTSKGVFIYGQDINNKTKLYFVDASDVNNGEFNFEEKLSVDYIDYIKPHNEDIIVSTYDRNNEYDRYAYNADTNTFEKTTAIDISDVYSFNNTFEYKGDIYFVNGSGSNANLRGTDFNNEGIFRIRKSLDSFGSIGYEIYSFIKTNKLYKNVSSAYGKIYTGILQIDNDKHMIVVSGKNADNSDFVVNRFILNLNATDEADKLVEIDPANIDRYDNPLLYDLNEIIDTEMDHSMVVTEQDRRGSLVNTPSYGLIVQRHSFRCDVNKLDDHNLSLVNKIDEYYFDKENKTIVLNKYGVSGTQDFKLNSEKIAYNRTINTDKQGLIIALGQDNALGIFDKDFDAIKVLTTGYIDRSTGQDIYVKLDPDYNTLQSVIIGATNTDLKVYGLYYGKFPRFESDVDTGKRYLDYSRSVTVYKVFSIPYETLKSSVDKATLSEEINFTYDLTTDTIRTELKDFIKTQRYEPSKDLNLTDTDIQVITTCSDMLYENTYSLMTWNSKLRCIQIYTKFRCDSSLKNPNDTSNTNQKLNSYIDGMDFERDSLYLNLGIDTSGQKFIKFNDETEGYINTKAFVCNLTNRKNLFFRSIEDYKQDILFDPSKYLKHMQTRFGVFRYVTEDYVAAVNKQLGTSFVYNDRDFNKIENIPDTYRSCEGIILFNAEGANSVVQITLGNAGSVVNIWETFSSVFILTKEYVEYLYSEQEVYNLYRVDLIPDTNRTEILSINDSRYFTKMDTRYARIYDMLDTPHGLLCVGTEPVGVSDTLDVNTDTSIYTGRSYVFWYNGDDFIIVKSWDHNDTTNWRKFTRIIQTDDKPLFIDPRVKEIWEYDQDQNTFTKTTEYNSLTNFIDNLDSIEYSRKYESHYPLPMVDLDSEHNILYIDKARDDNKFDTYKVDLTDKTETVIYTGNFANSTDSAYYNSNRPIRSLIRYPIVRPSDTSRNYNHDFIQSILSKSIPINKNLKVIGSIVCDGVRFNVSGMKIETHAGENNKEFKTLVFNIDKYYRSNLSKEIFTEEPGIIKFGFGNVEKNIQKLNLIILY